MFRYTSNDFGNMHMLKGDKLKLLKNVGIFCKYAYEDNILIDDNKEHIQSAKSLGIQFIQADEKNYLNNLCSILGFYLTLPTYDSYDFGWDSLNRRVTLLEADGECRKSFRLT